RRCAQPRVCGSGSAPDRHRSGSNAALPRSRSRAGSVRDRGAANVALPEPGVDDRDRRRGDRDDRGLRFESAASPAQAAASRARRARLRGGPARYASRSADLRDAHAVGRRDAARVGRVRQPLGAGRLQDIAVHRQTLWTATPAGLVSRDGNWSFNPDTFRVVDGPSEEAGRTATDLRVDGAAADVRYDGARAYRIAIDGPAPRPAVRLQRDPFVEQTFDVDARYWAWRISGRTGSS